MFADIAKVNKRSLLELVQSRKGDKKNAVVAESRLFTWSVKVCF